MSSDPMRERTDNYLALVALCDDLEGVKLHTDEAVEVRLAADALLFSDTDSDTTVARAVELFDRLERSGRFESGAVARMQRLLSGCGAPVAAC